MSLLTEQILFRVGWHCRQQVRRSWKHIHRWLYEEMVDVVGAYRLYGCTVVSLWTAFISPKLVVSIASMSTKSTVQNKIRTKYWLGLLLNKNCEVWPINRDSWQTPLNVALYHLRKATVLPASITLGDWKPKKILQSFLTLTLPVSSNFIKKRLIIKSNELLSDLFKINDMHLGHKARLANISLSQAPARLVLKQTDRLCQTQRL